MIDQEDKYVISQQTKKIYYMVVDERNDGENEFNLNFINSFSQSFLFIHHHNYSSSFLREFIILILSDIMTHSFKYIKIIKIM